MDREKADPARNAPNLAGPDSFSLDRLISHIDPGPAEESEAFVRLIYEQRNFDASSDEGCVRREAVRRMKEFSRESKLSLGEPVTRDQLHEGHRF